MARLLALLAVFSGAVFSTVAQNQMAPTQQQCDAALLLVQGINLNIADQKNEQAALAQVAATLQANPVNMVQFSAAKSNLLIFVNNGIAIRQMNQQITPQGNRATVGIAKVANAQLEELGLVMGLTGNPAKDNSVVATLQMDFAGGVMQNMMNMADAMAGCGPPGPAPVAAAGGNTKMNATNVSR